MQMFHRGGRNTERAGSYSNDSGFNHGPANNDGVEVNNDQVYFCFLFILFTNQNTIKILSNRSLTMLLYTIES